MNDNVHTLTYKDIETKIRPILENKIEFCYLLGSAATPRFNETSDIDLAVFWNSLEIDYNFKLNILNELEDLFKRNIDLVSLNDIDVIFAIQVLDTGKLLINNNPEALLKWQTGALSQYPDFKMSRQIIEKNILNRKKYVRD